MNNQKILTPKEQDENTKRQDELIELVASGEAVLIVGAGSSMRVGYPGWSGLIKELEKLASKLGYVKPDEGTGEDDLLAYAEDIKSYIYEQKDGPDKYKAWLYKLFESKPIPFDDCHKKLVSLPFRGILTTNYDPVLDLALLETKREAGEEEKQTPLIDQNSLVIGHDPPPLIRKFLLARNNDPQIPQRIVHLHGMYQYPESIILSSKDYQEAYEQEDSELTFRRGFLLSVLAGYHLVFVGFSMEDPYFNKMLEIFSKDFWGWDDSTHFAIMSISPESAEDSRTEAEDRKSKYGVATVFYENYDKRHQGLEDIVDEIAKSCHEAESDWLKQTNPTYGKTYRKEN